MAIHSAASTAGSPIITESEIVRPPPTTWIAEAMSSSPSRRNTNQATTATCPTNIAAKMNRPHKALPQNFQIRGGRGVGVTVMGGPAGSRESINRLSSGGKHFENQFYAGMSTVSRPRRHGRTCSGHPRLALCKVNKKGVDARNTSGHDENWTSRG